jgi:hypothetical protein
MSTVTLTDPKVVEEIAEMLVNTAFAASAHGLHAPTNLHGLSPDLLRTIAADSAVTVDEFPNAEPPFITCRAFCVALFAVTNEVTA